MNKADPAKAYPPAVDTGPYNKEAFKAQGYIQASLLLASLACGARTAGSIIWQGGAGGLSPNGGVGKADDHHNVSHNDSPADVWVSIDNWYAGRYARVGDENGGRNAARNASNRSLSDLWTTVYRACGGQGNFGEDVAGPITEIWSG